MKISVLFLPVAAVNVFRVRISSPFMGKPIIAYSIEAALQSGLFDEVMVSTDDEEIAEIACGYRAKVPFMRSAETSNDYARSGRCNS